MSGNGSISGGGRLGVEAGRDELRDALAGLFTAGDAHGRLHPRQVIEWPDTYFKGRWPAEGERTEWPALQRVLDAIAALPRSASIPKTGFGNLTPVPASAPLAGTGEE